MSCLEESIIALTKEMKRVGDLLEQGGSVGGTEKPAAAAKPAAAKSRSKPTEKPKPAAPEHDKDEVAEIIRRVASEVDKPTAKGIMADLGCKDLADLLGHPEHFDAAYTAAEAALDEGGADDAEEDDGL